MKITKNKMTRLKKQAALLTDELGELKDEKNETCEIIDSTVEAMKKIFKVIDVNEINGDDYKSLFSKHTRTTTDGEAVARSFKPTKRRIKKYTTSQVIKSLKTSDI